MDSPILPQNLPPATPSPLLILAWLIFVSALAAMILSHCRTGAGFGGGVVLPSRHGSSNGRELARILRRLEAVNRKSWDRVFLASNLIRVPMGSRASGILSDGVLPVLKGEIAFRSKSGDDGSGLKTKEAFFTLLAHPASQWASENPRMFEPLYIGPVDSVFLVNMNSLEEDIQPASFRAACEPDRDSAVGAT